MPSAGIGTDPPPDIGTDLFGHVLHSAKAASPYIAEHGRVHIQQEGYRGPACVAPGCRPRARRVTSS
ncbi:hypothetical protein ACFCX0_21055 [Streptomyces sp. NPDC056352]|uniref:hypothetical protein n=1 Tax=Streptomyces sp. NPDC056352 TaxID=3345791 RepID=UPI0035D97082